MRILFVTPTYPEDIQRCTHGIHQRMKMFMQAINGIADLDILFYVSPHADISPARASRMEKLLAEHWQCNARVFLCRRSGNTAPAFVAKLPSASRLTEWWFLHPHFYGIAGQEHVAAFTNCLEAKPDAIFIHRINPVLPVLSNRQILPPVFFDLDDIEHRLFARNVSQPPYWRSKFLQYLKVPSLVWLEYRTITQATRTFVCSEADKDYLAKFGLPRVVSIPNAVDMPSLHGPPVDQVFLFVGNYSHEPNVIAADYLLKNVWPIVKHELPEAALIIAGKNPENIRSFTGYHEGVEFRGFVDDLDALYRECRVVCCPIQSGSGTRVKMVEAAAYGKAMVSTSLGAEGLDYANGQEIFVRDDCNRFAQACIDLARDLRLCRRIGEAARLKTEKLYDRGSVMKKIRAEITAVLASQ